MRLADLRIATLDRVVVARLDGEIDLSNAAELGGVIADRVPNEALGLVIDLTEVDYVDSAGIHVLFDLRARLKDRGQEIRLVVPPGAEIFDALRIAYLPGVVGVFDSLDAATESIADKAPPGH
jgi:anti-anti-sigma factor